MDADSDRIDVNDEVEPIVNDGGLPEGLRGIFFSDFSRFKKNVDIHLRNSLV